MLSIRGPSQTCRPRKLAGDNVAEFTDKEVRFKPIGREGYCFLSKQEFLDLQRWMEKNAPDFILPKWRSQP